MTTRSSVDWMKLIEIMLMNLGSLRRDLGQCATIQGEESDLGKRQTLFENLAVATIKKLCPGDVRIEAEGSNPIGPDDAKWILGVDPTDGTAGDVRSHGAGVVNGLPVTAVLAVRENVPNPTFSSVKCAGILDLRYGDISVASERTNFGGGFYPLLSSNQYHKINFIKQKLQYNDHAPAIATEIARRANSFLRFLIPYGLYPEVFADSNSSAMVMLWALQGYCDAWLNFNLPGITGAGQRGHELGAISVFARSMSACAVQTKVENDQVVVVGPLNDAPYTFDGQTEVILGVDRKVVDHYLNLINVGLRKTIYFSGISGAPSLSLPVTEVLAELYRQYPDEQWSLPLISK